MGYSFNILSGDSTDGRMNNYPNIFGGFSIIAYFCINIGEIWTIFYITYYSLWVQ